MAGKAGKALSQAGIQEGGEKADRASRTQARCMAAINTSESGQFALGSLPARRATDAGLIDGLKAVGVPGLRSCGRQHGASGRVPLDGILARLHGTSATSYDPQPRVVARSPVCQPVQSPPSLDAKAKKHRPCLACSASQNAKAH